MGEGDDGKSHSRLALLLLKPPKDEPAPGYLHAVSRKYVDQKVPARPAESIPARQPARDREAYAKLPPPPPRDFSSWERAAPKPKSASAKKAPERTASEKSSDKAAAKKPTTVMLKHVPVGYSRTGFCEAIAGHGFGYAIDFLYLPIDSNTGLNCGHCFINVRTEDAYHDFVKTFHRVPAKTCLPEYESDDLCEVTLSPVQGRDANLKDLCTAANFKLWMAHDEASPLFLDDYGNKMTAEQWHACIEAYDREMRGKNGSNGTVSPAADPQLQRSSSPPLRAEAKEFSPPSRLKAQGGVPAVSSPSLNANAPVFSPSLRAEANEFVPAAMNLPESAFVD